MADIGLAQAALQQSPNNTDPNNTGSNTAPPDNQQASTGMVTVDNPPGGQQASTGMAPVDNSGGSNSQDAADVIAGYYQQYLGRTPDPTGLVGWADAAQNGSMSLDQVKQGFLNSQEYATDKANGLIGTNGDYITQPSGSTNTSTGSSGPSSTNTGSSSTDTSSSSSTAGTPPPAFNSPYTQDQASVAHQLQGLLSQGSPYLQQAETQTQQSAQSRGLLNSSMAATAGDQAAISSALPIAEQDAATAAQSNLSTQTANQTAQLNQQQNLAQELMAGNANATSLNVAQLQAAVSYNSQRVGLTQSQINAYSTAGTNLINGWAQIANNTNMTADERNAAEQQLLNQYSSIISAADALATSGNAATITASGNTSTTTGGVSTPSTTTASGAHDANVQAVTSLYSSILGRSPDQAGLAGWVAQLDSGTMGIGQITQAFMNSDEYKSNQATASASAQQSAAANTSQNNGGFDSSYYVASGG